jgi:hypothetical protein
MVLVAACATTPAAPPGFNVTGTWTGTWSYADPTVGSGDVRAILEQEGDQVSGRFEVSGSSVNHTNKMYGSVFGNEIRLLMPATGTLTVRGDQITGTINGLNVAHLTLKKQ